MYKKLGIVLVVFVLSFWFWVIARTWVDGGIKFALVDVWLKPLIILIIFSAILAVSYVVLWQERIRWFLPLIVGFTFLIVYGLTLLNLAAVGLLYLISTYAVSITAIEVRDRTKLHSSLAMRRGMTAIVVPLLLCLSFAFYQSPSLQEKIRERRVPVSFRAAVSKAVELFLDSENENGEIPQEAKERAINRSFDQFMNTVYAYADRYEHLLPPIVALGLFLVLWGLSIVFIYASLGVAVALFWSLKQIGFIKIAEVQVTAERLIL